MKNPVAHPTSGLRNAIWATLLMAVVSILLPSLAVAAEYFVRDAAADDTVSAETVQAATSLVKNAVAARSRDQVVSDEYSADYLLQPRLLHLGSSWVLTVEKIRSVQGREETVFAAQTKITNIDQLDAAARAATAAAIEEPTLPERTRRDLATADLPPAVPYRVAPLREPAASAYNLGGSTSGSTYSGETGTADNAAVAPSQARLVNGLPVPARKIGYWTIGVGPFLSRHLSDDNVFYDLNLGHTWDINPRVSVKAFGEGNFSSGRENSRFYNLAVGANYYVPTASPDTSPYATVDFGYGFARDANADTAEGLSFGTGVGFQFFRNTETTMDLLVRYAVVLDQIGRPGSQGNPSVAGARLAVNF